ncbi:C40 family peptidase [Gordonia sp. X0973]|uniref:C40 family peptidase n=1 Tax=Gordonia sp. X0973 TaxID=2742602 RepID=UPI000F52662C|nr:C40 family peptidase [Gordonia sp. X0973]QKT07608.1 C40 family peptidase [Gordonia sp. X0973]
MAKHRLEQPSRGTKAAKGAVITGAIAMGSLAAGQAAASTVTLPHLGNVELGALGDQINNSRHHATKGKSLKVKKASKTKAPAQPGAQAQVQVPNVGTFSIPGIAQKDIPKELQPNVKKAPGLLGAVRQTVADKAVHNAESKIGSPYSYGSAGPNAFDCSGLVYWSYKKAGKTIPRDSYGQLSHGKAIAYKDAKPGDVLIFNGGSHAGIYIGHGEFIHSETYGVPVHKAKVKTWALTGVRRY